MNQERVKLFIVTYKRTPALHVTLRQIFNDTDFMKVYPQTEVYIINNHSEFYLHPFLSIKVSRFCTMKFDLTGLAET